MKSALWSAPPLRQRRSPGAEHFRKELLGQLQNVIFNPVLHHQKPSCQAGLCLMQFVASGNLAHSQALLLHNLKDAAANFLIEERGLEIGKENAMAGSGQLHETVSACLGWS